MKFVKCCLYSILIVLLIIILIKTINALRYEGFDENVKAEETNIVEEPEKTEEEKEEEVAIKEIEEHVESKQEDKNIITQIVDKVSDIVNTNTTIVSQEPTTNIEGKQKDINIVPNVYDSVSSTIMDGPKLNKSEVLSPWYQAYGVPEKDNYLIDLGCENQDCGSFRFARSNSSGACGSPQYPVPFKLRVDPSICANKDKYLPNPYMGDNSWDSVGQSCQTKENLDALAGRGGNA